MVYESINIPLINTNPGASKKVKLFFNPSEIVGTEKVNIRAVLDAWMPIDPYFGCQSPPDFLPTDSILKAVMKLGRPVETQGSKLGIVKTVEDVFHVIQVLTKKFETFDINFNTSGVREEDDFARIYFTTLFPNMDMTLPRAAEKNKAHRATLPQQPPPSSNFPGINWFFYPQECFDTISNNVNGFIMKPGNLTVSTFVLEFLEDVHQLFLPPYIPGFNGYTILVFDHAYDSSNGGNTKTELGEVAAHELGHAFDLYHWGDTSNNYGYRGGLIDASVGKHKVLMGADVQPEQTERMSISQWGKGDYPNSQVTPKYPPGFISADLLPNPVQKDIQYIENFIQTFLKKRSPKYISTLNDYTRKNTEFGTEVIQCLQVKVIGKEQMNDKAPGEFVLNGVPIALGQTESGPDDPDTIIGMIGFPYDFEISKVLLEAGEYEISLQRYQASMLDAKMTLLHPRIELNKTKYKLRQPESQQLLSCSDARFVYYNKEIPIEKQFYSCIGFDAMNICPICDYIPVQPTGQPDNAAEPNTNQNPHSLSKNAGTEYNDPSLKIKVNKRTFIYILVTGASAPGDDNQLDKNQINMYSRYGSIGKYRIKGIPKDKVSEISEPFDCYPTENSENFLESEDAPEFHKHYSPRVTQQFDTYFPNGETKHFLKTIENGKLSEPVFFLQEKEDFPIENPEEKDIPFTKFFPVVINGKLYGQIDGCSNCGPEETKFVVYGKEYDPADTSGPSEDKVSFYYIKNENGETKKLEFIVYDVESPDGECAASSSRDTSRFFSYNTLIDFVN